MPIKRGPKTDLAVANACGLDPFWSCGGIAVTGESYAKPFSPSTDLNDAFLAAEKADFPFALVRQKWASRWTIESIDPRIGSVAQQPTPALAICAAILKLAETK